MKKHPAVTFLCIPAGARAQAERGLTRELVSWLVGRGSGVGVRRLRGGAPEEDNLGELGAVDAAIGCKHAVAKFSGYCRHCRTTGRLKFMHYVVGVNNTNAKLPKELGKRAFAAGDSACQSDFHLLQFAAGAGVTLAVSWPPASFSETFCRI